MKKENLQKLVLSAMFFGLGLVLPFLTGQIPKIGNMLLPMHIPVLLCGLICGWKYGGTIGFFVPLVRSLTFGMPVLYPNAIGMAFELLTYGILSGILYEKFHWHCIKALYKTLLITALSGRIVWGIAQVIMLGLGENGFTLALFVSKGFLNAIPGLILQFILIPAVMLLLKRKHLLSPKFHSSPNKSQSLNHNI